MFRILVLLAVLAPSSLVAQIRIHDPVVSLLAKPFGIEDRIKFCRIDELHFGPEDECRMVVTLENSGVKEVTLCAPEFELEVSDSAGQRIALGKLKTPAIVFPVTAEDESVKRTHAVEFKPALASDELLRRLREASKRGAPLRLFGYSGLEVQRGGGRVFKRKRLLFELAGRTSLNRRFKPVWHRKASALPACGLVGGA